ncbi:efflux RND transporter periplasmic adaptor subunit [Chloroflexota bacterium]
MRTLKTIVVISLLCTIILSSFGCASESDAAPVLEDNQVIIVQRGNQTIDITAVGNLALSRTEDLAIDLFYGQSGSAGTKGTVGEVLVEEGDSVKEGQVLVTVDKAEWDDELSTLEDKVTTAERSLTAAERNLTTKQRELVQADINLRNATIALEQTDTTYTIYDLKVAEADVDEAERNLQEVIWKLSKFAVGTSGYEGYQKLVVQAQARLNTAENTYDAMLSGFDTDEVAVKKLTVELNEARLVEAQNAIEDAQTAIEDTQKELWDAQEELDKANSQSPEVRATFDGFVTLVNVEGGGEVLTGTVVVQIADPNKFEAEVLVSEMDILQIKMGGEARVQVDAVKGLNLPAKVTHISPTATIQSGVVNYTVKVEIQSLQPVQQEASQEQQLPERLRQAIEEGRISQEQAEEMMKQGQGGQQQQMPTAPLEDFQLREGLTVTVSILVDERNDVLLVPNKVITRRGAETYVQVLKDGTIEERSIKTGISDYQNTEVTDGLSEGEQVIVPTGTSTTSTTSQQSGGGFVPGVGRILR